MRRILAAFTKTSEERINHPFVGPFLMSWIGFNWRPIFVVLFSSKSIEDKIAFVRQFDNLNFLLWFPLLSAVFYTLLLPYISLGIEWLLQVATNKKNQSFLNQQKSKFAQETTIELEKIKLEEAKTEFRERKAHNKVVEDLQLKVADYEQGMRVERERNEVAIATLRSELMSVEEILAKEREESARRDAERRIEVERMKERYDQAESTIRISEDRWNNMSKENNKLLVANDDLRNVNKELENELKNLGELMLRLTREASLLSASMKKGSIPEPERLRLKSFADAAVAVNKKFRLFNEEGDSEYNSTDNDRT